MNTNDFDKPSVLKETNVTYSAQSGAVLGNATVPTAGGEIEVLAWRVTSKSKAGGWVNTTNYSQRPKWVEGEDPAEYVVTELVDRAHVTRLQAEVERLRYERDCARGLANLATTNLSEYKEDMQSELTKARELLMEIRPNWIRAVGTDWIRRLDEFLAHQSAPAAKGDIDE